MFHEEALLENKMYHLRPIENVSHENTDALVENVCFRVAVTILS